VRPTLFRQFTGKYAPAALLAVAATLLLLARWAAARPMWVDEEMISLNVRGRGIFSLHGALWLGQSAPLGWLIVERCAYLVFGAVERSLRALPVAFGIALSWTAFWVGRRSMGPFGAACLVLLCSFAVWVSFHALELKPYSADSLFGLLLPALAARALATPEGGAAQFRRRARGWWLIAAAAQWLSNGAMLVAPTTGAVLAAESLRRRGWRGLGEMVLPAAAWAASFSVHYALTTRFAVHSRFLRDYWQFALPPAGVGVVAALEWVAAQILPFAVKPGSSSFPVVFWIAAAAGLALAMRVRPALGLTFAPIPIAGFAFAAAGQVPLFERLSLWIVPSLFVGISVLGDIAIEAAMTFARDRRWMASAAALVPAALSVAAIVGVAKGTWGERYLLNPRIVGNHELDDRAAVRWMMARREPGDVIITTHLAEPAVWWYGGVSIADPDRGRRQSDGSPILAVDAGGPPRACDQGALASALRGRKRALVFLGFRFDDQPAAFDDLLFWRLSDLGLMTAYRGFAQRSRVAVFDLSAASRPRVATVRPGAKPDDPSIPVDRCIQVAEAERW